MQRLSGLPRAPAVLCAALLVLHLAHGSPAEAGWRAQRGRSMLADAHAAWEPEDVRREAPADHGAVLSGLAPLLLQGLSPHLNISAAATVHGWVAKAGALDLQLWHSSFRQERVARFNQWLRATRFSEQWRAARRAARRRQQQQQQLLLEDAAAGAAPLPEPPPVVFPGCQVFVNHQYKFLYVRHPKTASTSVLKYFTECEARDDPTRGPPGPACVSPLGAAAELTGEQAARLFSDYFVFTVVRSPFRRALSSYKFLVNRLAVDRPGCAAPAARHSSWDEFCADPAMLGAMCQGRPACCVYPAGFFWHHSTLDQARCLVAGGGEGTEGGSSASGSGGGQGPRWVVDFIARQEHFDSDMAQVLAEIDRRRPAGLPPVAGGVLSVENAAQPFAHCTASTDGGEQGAAGQQQQRQQEQLGEAQLQRRQRPRGTPAEVWVGRQRVAYNASAPGEQYCEPAQYFEGRHAACLRTLAHFYRRDFELLYGGLPAGLDAAVPPVAAAATA